MTFFVLCLFLVVPWIGLQTVVVAFPSLLEGRSSYVYKSVFSELN